MMRNVLLAASTGLSLLIAAPVSAQGDPALERDARALEVALIAPCCFTQQVSVHRSAAADDVRRDVRARLAAGESRDQILGAYVARYGKRILAEPPARGFDRSLYIGPAVLLLLTLATVLYGIARAAAPVDAAGGPAGSVSDPSGRENDRLDEELRDLD